VRGERMRCDLDYEVIG